MQRLHVAHCWVPRVKNRAWNILEAQKTFVVEWTNNLAHGHPWFTKRTWSPIVRRAKFSFKHSLKECVTSEYLSRWRHTQGGSDRRRTQTHAVPYSILWVQLTSSSTELGVDLTLHSKRKARSYLGWKVEGRLNRASSRLWDDFSHSTCLLCLIHLTGPALTFLRERVTSLWHKPCFAVMRTASGGPDPDGLLDAELWLPPSPRCLGLGEGSCPGPRLGHINYGTCTDSENMTFFSFNVWEIIHLWRGWILQALVHLHFSLTYRTEHGKLSSSNVITVDSVTYRSR